MMLPSFEVADIIRRSGGTFIDRYRDSLTWGQLKVLRAIERCRTAALGGHRDRCLDCRYRSAISFHSCRNRHCPKCQTNAREKWLRARQDELLPVNYFHIVFSVPHELVPLIWQNKRALFHLLFEACAHQGKNRTILHVLPKGFPRIRYFGWMANRRRAGSLLLCRSLLAQQSAPQTAAPAALSAAPAEWQCPHCSGSRHQTERLTQAQILFERMVVIADSS